MVSDNCGMRGFTGKSGTFRGAEQLLYFYENMEYYELQEYAQEN